MDEKLIFNNQPDPQAPPPAAPPEQPPSESPPADGGETPPPSDTPPDQPASEEVYEEELPAQNPWIEILKKVGIGLGIVLALVFLVVLFMPKEKGAKNVTLIWWGLWEDARTVEPVILDFQKQHPNIKIRYIKQDPEGYRGKLLTRIKQGANEAPDIFRYHNTWLPMMKDTLATLPVDVIAPADFQKNYYSVMQKDLVQGGIYGIPVGADSLSLFVNTDLLNDAQISPPATWEDFCRAAIALTKKDDTGRIEVAGAALGTYGNITHASDIISLLFEQQGVTLSSFSTATEQEKVKLKVVLDFYTSYSLGGKSCPSTSVWDETLDPSLVAFGKGKLAMYLGFSWDIFVLEQINKTLPYKIYPAPLIGRNSKTIASYWVEGVSNKSPNQKEAFEFMKFLTQKETLQKLYTEQSKSRKFGEPYPRTDMADSLKNSEIYPFVSQLTTATSSYFASDTHDGEDGLNTKLNSYLQNAINSIIKNSDSPETTAENLMKGVAQITTEYGLISQ